MSPLFFLSTLTFPETSYAKLQLHREMRTHPTGLVKIRGMSPYGVVLRPVGPGDFCAAKKASRRASKTG